jgi:hypothetical protein
MVPDIRPWRAGAALVSRIVILRFLVSASDLRQVRTYMTVLSRVCASLNFDKFAWYLSASEGVRTYSKWIPGHNALKTIPVINNIA